MDHLATEKNIDAWTRFIACCDKTRVGQNGQIVKRAGHRTHHRVVAVQKLFQVVMQRDYAWSICVSPEIPFFLDSVDLREVFPLQLLVSGVATTVRAQGARWGQMK